MSPSPTAMPAMETAFFLARTPENRTPENHPHSRNHCDRKRPREDGNDLSSVAIPRPFLAPAEQGADGESLRAASGSPAGSSPSSTVSPSGAMRSDDGLVGAAEEDLFAAREDFDVPLDALTDFVRLAQAEGGFGPPSIEKSATAPLVPVAVVDALLGRRLPLTREQSRGWCADVVFREGAAITGAELMRGFARLVEAWGLHKWHDPWPQVEDWSKVEWWLWTPGGAPSTATPLSARPLQVDVSPHMIEPETRIKGLRFATTHRKVLHVMALIASSDHAAGPPAIMGGMVPSTRGSTAVEDVRKFMAFTVA